MKNIVISLTLLLLVSCGEENPVAREYEESVTKAQTGHEGHNHEDHEGHSHESPAKKLSWTKPASWTEEGASGMRMATFKNTKNLEAVTCTIVAMGGGAGGMQANLSRWVGQLGDGDIGEERIKKIASEIKHIESQGGLKGQVTELVHLSAKASSQAMTVAVFKLPSRTLFLKMSGVLSEVKSNREAFDQLCSSLDFK